MRDDYLQKAREVIPDPYILVNVISRRVKQLRRGSRPLVERGNMTDLEVVIQEILQDKIAIDYEASGLHSPENER